MTLSILVFNFYPVTAIMIVLLNDGAILSIAYDNVRPSAKPEAWNMHRVLGISTMLGISGVSKDAGVSSSLSVHLRMNQGGYSYRGENLVTFPLTFQQECGYSMVTTKNTTVGMWEVRAWPTHQRPTL